MTGVGLKQERAVKHITSLPRLGVRGGRTLISGQLQSSPAPSRSPEESLASTHTERTPNPLSLTDRAGSNRKKHKLAGVLLVLSGLKFVLEICAESVYIG